MKKICLSSQKVINIIHAEWRTQNCKILNVHNVYIDQVNKLFL